MSKRAGYLWNRLVKIVLEIVKLALIWVFSPPVIGWILVLVLILIDLKLVKKEKVVSFLLALTTKFKWNKGTELVIKLRDKWLDKT